MPAAFKLETPAPPPTNRMAFLAREMAGAAIESPARRATTGFFMRRLIGACESKNYLKERPIHYKFTALYPIRVFLRRSCTTRANDCVVKSGKSPREDTSLTTQDGARYIIRGRTLLGNISIRGPRKIAEAPDDRGRTRIESALPKPCRCVKL